MENVKKQRIFDVVLTDRFWKNYKDIVAAEVIPYQWGALNDELPDTAPSHAIENFRIAAGEAEGSYYGTVFQDSDVAKWLETVAYSLRSHPDAELEQKADEVIALMGRAQGEDGYLNTYYMLVEPGNRWSNLRDNHELYCAGHLIEAAVAYYETTGKTAFLEIVEKYTALIQSLFGREEGKRRGYPGHPEIELALLRLYDVTGKETYLELAAYFLTERGQAPHYFEAETSARQKLSAPATWNDHFPNFGLGYAYMQAHKPVIEQTEAEGHAVRAMYLYTAMADLAEKQGDKELAEACNRLWENVTSKKLYITGGIGSSVNGEAFTDAYDLPNDSMYCETCASVGLVFWANRMLRLRPDRKYADVLERAIYNGTISGMDLNGKRFFYVNPLEINQHQAQRKDQEHVKPVRQKWFACACCPPNLARMIASIEQYAATMINDTLYNHLYLAGSMETEINGVPVTLLQQHDYPWDGEIKVTVQPQEEAAFGLAFRIPGWCDRASVTVNGQEQPMKLENGYIVLHRTWRAGDVAVINLPMTVNRIYSHPNVSMNQGQTALQRGPIVYCVEEADNGSQLASLRLPENTALEAVFEEELLGGVTAIYAKGYRIAEQQSLYSTERPKQEPVIIKAIPYFAWCNREPGEMQVWIRE